VLVRTAVLHAISELLLEGGVEPTLEDVARLIHGHNLRIGSSYLQLVLRRRQIARIAQFTGRPGRARRHDSMTNLATEVWLARGGQGQVPESVVNSFI
jgi:hypothetical protein